MPTVVFRNTTEGYSADGTNVTQGVGGNSGAGSGDYWDLVTLNGGTIQAKTAAKKHGTYGYRLTRSGTSQISLQKTFPADITDCVGQRWMQLPTQPSVNTVVFKGYSDAAATVTSWAVSINTTGKMLLLAGTGSTQVFAGTSSIPPAVDVRFEIEIVAGTSIRCVAYSGDSNTVLQDSGIVATTLVAATRTIRVGLLTTGSAPTSVDFDDDKWGSGPGFFGLSTVAIPTEDVANPGGFVPTGAATNWQALATTVSGTPTAYAESPATPAGAQYTAGFSANLLPTGGLTVNRWDRQDVASPVISSKLEILVGGAVVGTNTVSLTTTWTLTSFTIASVAGDMSTLQARYTDT